MAFLELQRRLWAELSDSEKDEVSDSRFLALTLKQLDAGVQCGSSECYLVGLLAVARFFIATGKEHQAHRFMLLAERYMPEEPTLLEEGWADFCRGELLCRYGRSERRRGVDYHQTLHNTTNPLVLQHWGV